MSKTTTNMIDSFEKTDKEKVADMLRLLDVAKAMTRIQDLDELLRYISETAVTIIDADRSSIFLVDHEHNELYGRITDEELKEIRFPVGAGIAGTVADTGEVINISDAYGDARFNQAIDKKTGYKTKNMLTIPLLNHKQTVVGVLQILNKKNGPFSDYDESLLLAMGSNAAIALDTAQLLEHYLEKQKMQAALGIAKEIQERLLPDNAPHAPGYDIAGFNKSADETGGDYYDYFPLKDGTICALVGDATGHGIGAALIVTTARALLKGLLVNHGAMVDVIYDLNNLLEEDSSSDRFMTMFMMVLDQTSHDYYYISAGHDEPQYWRASEEKFYELDSTGMPLGMMDNMDFECSETARFEVGDYIFISTDGIWEAPNNANERYGKDRLQAVLKKYAHCNAEEMINEIIKSLTAFTGTCPQADDVTIVLIKRVS